MRVVTGLAVVLFFGMSVLMVSCAKKTPVANGKNILTVEQYNQLMAKMKVEPEKKTGNGAAAAATATEAGSFAEGARLYREEQYGQAATAFQGVLKTEPGNSRAWFLLGSCQEKAGNLDEAQGSYKKSYDLMVKQGYIPASANAM